MSRLRGLLESGFTLVELLIYSLLTVLVLAIVGGILISGMTAERLVRGVTEATSLGQIAANSVEQGVRNAAGFQLSAPNEDDQLLLARSAGSGSVITWTCEAWYYSGIERTIRTFSSPSKIDIPNSNQLKTWRLLADGVSPYEGEQIFTNLGKRLALQFRVDAGDHSPVKIESSVLSRAGALETAPCF